MFAAFDVKMIAGRLFEAAGASIGASAVVVTRTFVEKFLDNGPAPGRQFRYTRLATRPTGTRLTVRRLVSDAMVMDVTRPPTSTVITACLPS